MDSVVTATINKRYQILALLGVGGGGAVYKARDIELSRVVALKTLHPEFVGDPESLERFAREARILGRLQHKNVVQIYSSGVLEKTDLETMPESERGAVHASGDYSSESSGTTRKAQAEALSVLQSQQSQVGNSPFIVMEFIEGKNLKEILSEREYLSRDELIRIAIQCCEGLSAAHKEGIVHRDLKPQNLVLEETQQDTTLKILDFGLSVLSLAGEDSRQKLTRTGDLLGSIHYMSPELCSGQKTDGRSDIYSLGCVLYECIAGKPPLEAESSIGILYLHREKYPNRLSELPHYAQIGLELEMVIFKALQKKAEDRFQSADELKECLEQVKSGAQSGLTAEVFHGCDNKKAGASNRSTHILLVLATIAVLAVAAVIIGVFVKQSLQKEDLRFAALDSSSLSKSSALNAGSGNSARQKVSKPRLSSLHESGLPDVMRTMTTFEGKRFIKADIDPIIRKTTALLPRLKNGELFAAHCLLAHLYRQASDSNNEQKYLFLAMKDSRTEKGWTVGALSVLCRLAELNIDNPEGLRYALLARELSEKFDEDSSSLIELDLPDEYNWLYPMFPWRVYNCLGQIYLKTDKKRALENFQKALFVNSGRHVYETIVPLLESANTLLELGQKKQAIEELEAVALKLSIRKDTGENTIGDNYQAFAEIIDWFRSHKFPDYAKKTALLAREYRANNKVKAHQFENLKRSVKSVGVEI